MPRRTQVFQQLPWTGGLNTAVDPGVIPSTDLQQADNILFTTAGIRRKREGISYFDTNSAIPTVTHRSSSGTTRTLVFNATLSNATVDKLIAGEGIIVTTTTISGNEFDYYKTTGTTVASLTTTNVTDDTITYTFSGASSLTESSTATSTLTVSRQYDIVKIVDYWRFTGSALAQQIVVSTEQPLLFRYNVSGNRKAIARDSGATARVGTAVKASAVVFNDAVILGQSRTGNTPIKYDPDSDADWVDLGGSPPDFELCAIHLNRVWTNDKTNRDRLHYSATANAEKWQGADDSGALDIRPGDGDPVGITGIFAFKGRLFVAKETKMYMVAGTTPEDFQVVDVSAGLGLIAHDSIAAVDQDDVLYISKKGVHSIATTNNYGDFSNTFVSSKIQPSFNDWVENRRAYNKAVYVPQLNSVVFAISEENTEINDNLWLYNVQNKEWYRWPNVAAQSLCLARIDAKPTLLIGDSAGRLLRAQNGTFTDYTSQAIVYRLKTGSVYPDNNAMTLKAFKRFTLFFRPTTSYNITIKIKIDKFNEQSFNLSGLLPGDTLGATFTLGSSILGTTAFFAPYTMPIDGIGHGCTIEVEQTGLNEQGDIYGFAIEWEPVDIAQEII